MTDDECDDAIKKAMPGEGEFIEFDGAECCDDSCRGWDGTSRRCECGNRRVEWTVETFGGRVLACPEVW